MFLPYLVEIFHGFSKFLIVIGIVARQTCMFFEKKKAEENSSQELAEIIYERSHSCQNVLQILNSVQSNPPNFKSVTYSGVCQTYKIEGFAKTVNGF